MDFSTFSETSVRTSQRRCGAILWVVLTLLFYSPQSYSSDQACTPPSNIPTDFDSVCHDTLADYYTRGASPTPAPDSTGGQKLEYCLAAAKAKKAADGNSALWKVWAAVGGLCLAACAASFAGIGSQYVCMAVDTAAGIADAVVTKRYVASLTTTFGGVAGSFMVNKMYNTYAKNKSEAKQLGDKADTAPDKAGNPSKTANQAGDAGKEIKENKPYKDKDPGACIIAATTAFQAYSNYKAAESHKKTKENSLDCAAALQSNASSTQTANASADGSTSSANGGATTSGSQNSNSTASGGTNADGTQNACDPTVTAANAGMMINCALASDSTVPKYVATPKFADDFKKNSGMDLGDFLGKATNPTQAIAAAGGGSLSSDQVGKVTAALQDMEKGMPFEAIDSTYGGGGRGPSGNGPDNSMNEMMANMMNQLMPKNPEDPQKQGGLEQVIFANKNTSPDRIAENPVLNIFDRITYRYYFVSGRMMEVERK